MRVAALYDIHGNLPALEAVLAEVDEVGADAIVVGGDLAWGPFPGECVRLVRERGALLVRGNCERSIVEETHEVDRWCGERLSDEEFLALRDLPLALLVGAAAYCHAAPTDDELVLTTLTPDEVVREAFADLDAPLVVTGHTHRQYDRDLGTIRVVNPGSVGLPYEGRPGAFWALVDGDHVELRQTDYDVEAAAARLTATGFPRLDLLEASLLDPAPPGDVAAQFERGAGRAA